MTRRLYLAAYDVACPKRLRRVLKVVKGHATGGQKSVFECWLTAAERRALLRETRALLRRGEDRFLLLRLDPRQRPVLLGRALPVTDRDFLYMG